MELDIELIKAQFYVAEGLILAEQVRAPKGTMVDGKNIGGQWVDSKIVEKAKAAVDKAVKDTGDAVGKAAESVSKSASEAAGKAGEAVDKAKKEAGAVADEAGKVATRTVEQAKKEVQTFVQDVFSKEHLDMMKNIKDTPENRKAVQKAFDDLGRKLSSDAKEAVSSAIKEAKKLDIGSIADKAVENTKKAIGSPEAKEIGAGIAIAGGTLLVMGGLALTVAGAATFGAGIATGSAVGMAGGMAAAVVGWTLTDIAGAATRAVSTVLLKKAQNQRQKEARDKLKEVLPEPKPKAPEAEDFSASEDPKKRKRDPDFDKLVLQFSGVDTEPDKSFKEKYKEENGKDYDKKSDPVVNKLNDDILDISAEIAEIIENSFSLNPESPEGKSAQDKVKQMNEKSKGLLKKRADYYKTQDSE